MKSKKPFFNQAVIYFFLIVSVTSFILCVWSIAPTFSMMFSSKEAKGEIIAFNPTDDETEFKLVYIYFNEYEKKDIRLVKRVHKRTYNKSKVGDTLGVVYSGLFPYRVYVPSLENEVFTSFILLIAALMMLFIFNRTVKILKGDLSLEDFLGVNKTLNKVDD